LEATWKTRLDGWKGTEYGSLSMYSRFVWLPIWTQLKEKYIVSGIIVYMESGPYASRRAVLIHPYSSGKSYVFDFMDGIRNDAKYSSAEYVFIHTVVHHCQYIRCGQVFIPIQVFIAEYTVDIAVADDWM
jgi:hypothetical protein